MRRRSSSSSDYPGSGNGLKPQGRCLRHWFFRLLWVGLLFEAESLQAHRPTESTAEFRWEHARLEARVTFPLEMATTLLEEPEVVRLDSESFSAHSRRLIELTSAAFIAEIEGQRVAPIETTVALTRGGEVECVLVFPPHTPAPLSLRAAFLEKLPADCFCLIRVWEGADRLLGRRLLVRSSPSALVLPSDQAPGGSEASRPPEEHRPSNRVRPPKP